MNIDKRYTQEFKNRSGETNHLAWFLVKEVSERLGIRTKSLYHWRSQLSEKPKLSKSTGEMLRIAKLES